jgi:hypothetical protein
MSTGDGTTSVIDDDDDDWKICRTSGHTVFANRLRGVKSAHFLSQDSLRATFFLNGNSRIKV